MEIKKCTFQTKYAVIVKIMTPKCSGGGKGEEMNIRKGKVFPTILHSVVQFKFP